MGGTGPEPVGNNAGINCFGTYDMAGNVREWCWNKSPNLRVIYGGAWNDVSYMATTISQLPAFNRSSKNGFRCAIYHGKDSIPEYVFHPAPISAIKRDYNLEEPVLDKEFLIYKKMFLYDKTYLNSKIEKKDESRADWILEKISFDAAYDNERMIAYLYLPKEKKPPFQTLIYFPGSGALIDRSFTQSKFYERDFDYLLTNGRAILFPIYNGPFERKDGICADISGPHQAKDCRIKWVKDLSRSIDYLETRKDIDTSRIGYLGDSWGGRMGAVIPAVEDRLKLSVLLRGVLPKW